MEHTYTHTQREGEGGRVPEDLKLYMFSGILLDLVEYCTAVDIGFILVKLITVSYEHYSSSELTEDILMPEGRTRCSHIEAKKLLLDD